MSFNIQIEDSFDFEKDYIRCTASRRVSISSDQPVTPEVLSSALGNAKISLPSGLKIEEVEFLDQEEEDRGRKHYDLLQKVGEVASRLLAAAPSIFSGMSDYGFLQMVESFPVQPSYSSWVNGTITAMPKVDMGEGCDAFTPLFLCVDRDSNGIDVRFVFEIGISSLVRPIESGEVINTIELNAFEDGANMILQGRSYISFPPVTAPAAH